MAFAEELGGLVGLHEFYAVHKARSESVAAPVVPHALAVVRSASRWSILDASLQDALLTDNKYVEERIHEATLRFAIPDPALARKLMASLAQTNRHPSLTTVCKQAKLNSWEKCKLALTPLLKALRDLGYLRLRLPLKSPKSKNEGTSQKSEL
eukprot:gnl/MRDRNA2_/MRDRNA2_232311_c0_seq1.p1 gnl/MRDRNA2_/MRDRNA2_232311_c0~~gnl/MRDRNA2_/MRDRNA2_232311_c0_seq1.p1  ORF type:complete len:165 (-),score=23.23 gnl/MRDRNA2_/MRDRNA2_232311_c0_seq1:501-959(-)